LQGPFAICGVRPRINCCHGHLPVSVERFPGTQTIFASTAVKARRELF
jgi:hypothetical protein